MKKKATTKPAADEGRKEEKKHKIWHQYFDLYRDDFKVLSDGSSYFDVILDKLSVPEEMQSKVDNVNVDIYPDFFRLWDEEGEELKVK